MRRIIFFISLLIVAGFFIIEIPQKTQAAFLASRRLRSPRPSPFIFWRPSPSPKLSYRVRVVVSPTPRPTPRMTPSPSALASMDTVKTYILNQINDFRRSKNLSPVEIDPYTCDFAQVRAQEIQTEFNHQGFDTRVAQKSLPYPSYQLVTENIAQIQKYQNVVNLWVESPGHAENMTKDTPFVCVERVGDYYAYEGWKP